MKSFHNITQDNLKNIRISLGIKAKDMAAMIHCTYRMYHYYETGQRHMPEKHLELLRFKIGIM